MTNVEKRRVKERITKLIENNSNNTVSSIKFVTEDTLECVCKNKYSNSHIINVVIGERLIQLIYDSVVFKTIIKS